MRKMRDVRKVRRSLRNTTPEKVKVIKGVLESDKNVRSSLEREGVVNSEKEQKRTKILNAVACDISEGFESVKSAHKKDDRAAHHIGASFVFGEKVRAVRGISQASRMFGIDRHFAGKKSKDRAELMSSQGKKCWLVTTRKVRKDAIDEETQNRIYKCWKENSRPAGSTKNDIIRKRLGKNHYIEHPRHVLEKTQLETYQDFMKENPDLRGKIGQRKFENLKPFFVRKAKVDDRQTCLCRMHVETKMVFTSCMKFRRQSNNGFPVWEHLTDVMNATMCPQQNGSFHRRTCIERSCLECGLTSLQFSPDELDDTANAPKVKWQ